MLSPLLVFFQLLNNWPSLLYFIWQSTVETNVPIVRIDIQRLKDVQLLNSPEELNVFLQFSVCEQNFPSGTLFTWEVQPVDGLAWDAHLTNCSIVCNTTHLNSLTVTMMATSPNGTRIAAGRQKVETEEAPWVAVIGDSFASGEGSPDKLAAGQWTDDQCHRSRLSFGQLVVQKYAEANPESTTLFSFLACSGATTETSMIGSPEKPSQLDMLQAITKKRGKGPDLVIMTIGANDVGFSEVLQALANPSINFSLFDIRFFLLAHELDRVAGRLRALGAKHVVLPLYYDITRNEDGLVDASCGAFRKTRTRRLADAEKKIFHKLNDILRRKGEQHSWTVVDSIPHLFSRGGVCSTTSLVRTPEESLRIQGSFRGAFHPNEKGHQVVADEVIKALEERSIL